jgi:hypothetical protein
LRYWKQFASAIRIAAPSEMTRQALASGSIFP